MAQVLISYVEEDCDLASGLARGLEESGLTAWYYQRDGLADQSYPGQIAAAIESCAAMVVVISGAAIRSRQMESEIVRGHELQKSMLPVLWQISHADVQNLKPGWQEAVVAASSTRIPPEGVQSILARVLGELARLGVIPEVDGTTPPTAEPADAKAGSAAPVHRTGSASQLDVDLSAVFDRTSYPPAEDPLAYCLTRLRVNAGTNSTDAPTPSDGPGVDVALVLDVSGSMEKPNRYPLLCEAVRRLVTGLGPQDWISVTLFTDRSRTVFPFLPAVEVAFDPEQIVTAMNESGLLFGPRTNLAPGLLLALQEFGSQASAGGRVRRTYILTDGELHDTPECAAVLDSFRPRSVEVHVYGFGDEFNAAALKRLVSDQIGGTVKPIANEHDITRTFAHVALVNRRVVATGAKLEVAFNSEVACGDAWVFQPHGRYLGTIQDRRVQHEFGGLEAGRWYSLLLELRLPPRPGAVGSAEVSWIVGDELQSRRIELIAERTQAAASVVPEVRRALNVVQILRARDDSAAELASYKARLELAILENRDPELKRALEKIIAGLSEPLAAAQLEEAQSLEPSRGMGERVRPSALARWTALVQKRTAGGSLTDREQLILDSDPSTAVYGAYADQPAFSEARLVSDLTDVLNDSIISESSNGQAMERAVGASRKYYKADYDQDHRQQAISLLIQFGEVLGVRQESVMELIQRLL